MATDWKIGDRIERRWEIHKILRGGMGIVYVVYDHEFHEPFAAKTFQEEVFARDPAIADRFQQEALAWTKLDLHPNIAQARFVQDIQHKPFLFLEYVSGGDLGGWIGTPRLTQDLPQVLKFAIQFCDGMTHALSKGIKAHRDIKPQNCLVTQDGTLKITDFGLAKVFDDASGTDRGGSGSGEVKKGRGGLLGRLFGKGHTSGEEDAGTPNVQGWSVGFSRTGRAAGTLTHMAPEQFDDAKRVDVRADVFSFGVMLYQMITGRLLFAGRSWEEFERLHKTQPAPDPKSKYPHLDSLVKTCLAKDPTRRFGNFPELRERLAELYKKETGQLAPQPVVEGLDAGHWNNKGISLENLGWPQEAVSCFDRALELNPRYEPAWINKGNTLDYRGRPEEALGCYQQALGNNPRSAEAWFNKGVTSFNFNDLRRHREALECLEKAQQLGHPQATQAIARCRQKLGESAAPAQQGQTKGEASIDINALIFKALELAK